jgi:hypothetical protein
MDQMSSSTRPDWQSVRFATIAIVVAIILAACGGDSAGTAADISSLLPQSFSSSTQSGAIEVEAGSDVPALEAMRYAGEGATEAAGTIYLLGPEEGVDGGAIEVLLYRYATEEAAESEEALGNPAVEYEAQGDPRLIIEDFAGSGRAICEAQSAGGCHGYVWWTRVGSYRIETIAWNWPDNDYRLLPSLLDEIATGITAKLPG